MTHKIRFSVVMLALLPLGCGANGADQEQPDVTQAGVQTGQPEIGAESATGRVLNQVRVAGGEVTFVEYASESGALAVMQETAPVSQGKFLSDLVSERHGNLTFLEMFYALAAEGALPDEQLVALHAEEARSLGRADATIKRVGYYGQELIEKSAATCNTWAYPEFVDAGWGDKAARDDVAGFNSICLASNCGLYRTNKVVAATCNDSGGSMTTRSAWGYKTVNNGAWNYTSWVTLTAGNKIQWTIPANTAPKRYAAMGDSAVGVGYRLRTGTLFPF